MYSLIIHLSTVLEDSIYETFNIEYVIFPVQHGGFTTSVMENIDNNNYRAKLNGHPSLHICHH